MADREIGRPRAVLIAGPTASGKSALAMAVAEASGGVVVDADSMQVYRELRILTARPSEADEARVPHRLYGHVAAAEGYTVARWLGDVGRALGELEADGRPAILVGGTGLYFTALTQGLSEIPPIPEEVRSFWRARGEAVEAEVLHAELAARDPETAARLLPSDRQRVLRALEVFEGTGQPLAVWQAGRSAPLLPAEATVRLVVAPERALLHRRIAERFHGMAASGGLAEARAFAGLRLDPALPAMKAIGVPEMIAAAIGARPVDEAVEAAITATRRYAKRQETWFRNQMPDWPRADLGEGGNILSVAGFLAQQMQLGG